MHIQIVTFQLKGISAEIYAAQCEQFAATFAQVPGLNVKYWLSNPEANTFGGVYIWESRAACERYRASELFVGVATNPFFANITVRDFAVLQQPTEITHGFETLAAIT